MPSKIRIVLEGYARYRDGKKWKKRYCVLSLSPTTPDALHLYITKSYDDFAAYRNSGSVLTAMLPPVRKLHELPISPESRALLSDTPNIIQRSSDHNQNTLTSQSSTLANYCPSITTSSGPLINTAAHSYNSASGNTLSGLATASNLASSVGGPAPVDEITGFESGYHMDKESNIIVLIGGSSVYALALAGMDEMFCWADNLARIVVDNRFRVTLRHSGDGSKLFQGLQGSLHVQHWRLCLIGEPSTGCKFICNWRLDHVDKAYTMTMPAQSANQLLSNNSNNNSTSTSTTITATSNSMTGITNNSTTFGSANLTTPASSISSSSFNTGNPLNLDHHRTGLRTGLTTMSTVPTATLITSPSTTAFNNPNKYLFFMECSPASGKGRGSYIFEIDGSRLAELTIAIEQFTALRYNPNLKPATCAEASQLTVTAQSNLGTTNFGTIDRCNKNDNLFRNGNPPICTIPTNIGSSVIDDLGIASSSFSSDTSSNPRSFSPTHHQQQQQLSKRRSRDSIFNPLRKISSGHHNFNLFKANDYQSSTIDRLFSKQTMSQFIVTTATTTTTSTINTATTTTSGTEQSLVPVLHSKYSWNFQRTSSLSPPDMIVNDSILDSYNPNSLSRCDHLHENSFKEQFNLSGGGGVSVVATTIGVTTNDNIQEGNNSPIEILNSSDKTSHNVGDFITVSNPDQSSMSNSNNNNPITSFICSCSPLGNTGTKNNSNTFPISSSSRLVDDVNVSSSSSSSSLMIVRDIIRNMSETNYFLDDNIQVAKVAAGLIISKKPPYYHHHQQQHCGSGYPTRISGLTPVCTIFTGASNTTSTSTACGAVKTGNCKQSLPSTVPSFRVSSTSSTRHHRHTHHHRFIFDGPNSSGNQSSSGCSTTAVLPSVPIPSIGTNSDINHNFMHSSLSSSSEYNRTQLHPESLLSKQRQYSQQYHDKYHDSLLNFISSCQTYNSLNTSTSDLNCSTTTTTTSSSVESTLDQVDNKNICNTHKNITNTITTTTTTTCVTSIRNSSNHEIFTADEDYWDLRDNSNCQHKLLIQSSKIDSAIVGVADTSKESDNLCVMTGTIPSDSVEVHTCKESSPYPCGLNQFTNTSFIYPHFYLSSIEPSQCIYRHRLQQYRVCNCISLLRRSFSANSNIQFIDLSNNDLQIFNFRPSLTLRTMRSLDSCIVPRSKSINDNSSIENTIGATDHDSKLYRTLQSYSTNPHISVQSPLCKSFCGGRFQKIHRLFHRKHHSQSHDNLECRKTSMDRSKLSNDIDFDTQLWDEVKSKNILCTNIPLWNCTGNDADTDETHENRCDRILDLSYRIFICPRHGVQSLHWNFSSDDGQQHISRLNTSRRDSVFQSKKLLKSTPVDQKHSNVSTLPPHLLNSIALPRPLSLVRLTTEKSKYHCSKSFEHYTKNKESKVTNLNFDKDSNDGNNDITSSIIDATSSYTLPKNKISHSLPPSNTTISSSTLTNQLHSFPPNNNYYYYAPISNRCPSLISLNSSSCSEPCLSKINLIHSLSSSFSVDYNHDLLEGHKLLSLNKDTSESFNNSQQYESLISSSSLSRNMKERNNNNSDSMLSDAQKLCHSEMTVGGSVLLSPSSSPPIPSIDLKYHPLFRCNNTVEKSLVGSLSNYCDVEFLNELRLYLLSMSSHHNVISNNNMPGLIESSQQRKNVNDTVIENVTCIHDMHHGSHDDSGMLQSSLHSDKQTQSLSSSASSSGGLTTTKSSDITWSKALYGNSTIDSNINESNYSINQLSCNSSTSNSNNRQSYLSKLFDRSISSHVKSLSPSIISPTIRANTLPSTRIRQQSTDHKNIWNNVNNHLICVNSSKVDTTNRDIVSNSNSNSSVNQKVNNRLHFLHHSDHRNSAMQDNHHFKINTTISSDKVNNILTRKFSHQSEIDHFSRIMTENISSSNNNKNNVNRRSRKSDGQLNDKSTLSNCNVEQQIPVEYPVYNNLIELRENVRPLSNDGVGSMLTYDLKSIPSLLSSDITSISGSLPSESLLSSQSLHVTISENNGYQHHHHLNQFTTANYVNLPMFWSNHHSTTTPTPSSMFSRSSTSCQRQHSTDVTATATTTIEPRLYANIMPSNTISKYQSVRNKQQHSKTDFSLLSKNHIRHSGGGIPPSVADCTGNSSSSNSSLTGESQLPSGVVIDHNSKIMDISKKSHSLDPTSVINFISTTTSSTIPQYCPVAVVARAQEAANLSTNSDYSNLPDEVRDPSRNYAMVDLRPSPASSTIPPTELTLNIIQHHSDHRTGQFTTCNSSSTSTGSSSSSGDCTSDAATLTSDTIESYETIGASNNNHSYNTSKLNKLKSKNAIDTDSYGGRGDDDKLLSASISSSRRRHSHSLSSVTTTDHPSILLNYIHVIAASNGRFTSLTTTTDGTVQLSGPCSVGDSNHNHNNKSLICDIGNSRNSSNSSSSALGGVTSSSSSSSHSTGSSLVPASSTSFGDTFSCRSMTSSGISSVEGGGGVAVSDMIELSSCSPSDENCVNYTQIDFARTMALGEISGDIMAQENQMLHKLPSTTTGIRIANRWSSSSSNKIDRTTSVKKTLCRSIRLIGRGTRKKVG